MTSAFPSSDMDSLTREGTRVRDSADLETSMEPLGGPVEDRLSFSDEGRPFLLSSWSTKEALRRFARYPVRRLVEAVWDKDLIRLVIDG